MERHVWTDYRPTLAFDKLAQRLRLQDEEDLALMAANYETAMALARPKAVWRECAINGVDGETVTVEGTRFASPVLAEKLANVYRVFAFVASCGAEVDEWSHAEQDPIVGLWLDILKEMILGDARAQFMGHLKERYALPKVSAMSPGSGNVDVWPIEQQKPLFALIGGVERDTGVRLTGSCLMLPTKSVSGILFATEEDFVTCSLCSRKNCPNRRAPSNIG